MRLFSGQDSQLAGQVLFCSEVSVENFQIYFEHCIHVQYMYVHYILFKCFPNIRCTVYVFQSIDKWIIFFRIMLHCTILILFVCFFGLYIHVHVLMLILWLCLSIIHVQYTNHCWVNLAYQIWCTCTWKFMCLAC